MKYKFEYMTLTQLGKLFGVSSHAMGRWLKELGLRTQGGSPSWEAFHDGFVTQHFSDGDKYIYVWDVEKTVKLLEAAGHERVPHPPPELTEPPVMTGPFTTMRADGSEFHITGGEVTISVAGEQNAAFICRLLNLADQNGILSKHFAKQV